LELTIEAVRTRLKKIEDQDVVSADLIHAQLLALEKHAWMLRSSTVVA
jgi:DNA-binding ferritin-like protein